MRSGNVRNLESARISTPPQLRKVEPADGSPAYYVWRTGRMIGGFLVDVELILRFFRDRRLFDGIEFLCFWRSILGDAV